MTIEDRINLRTYLKRGDLMEIARLSGVHVNSVSNFVNGKILKSGCEHYFASIALKRKEEAELRIKQLRD